MNHIKLQIWRNMAPLRRLFDLYERDISQLLIFFAGLSEQRFCPKVQSVQIYEVAKRFDIWYS